VPARRTGCVRGHLHLKRFAADQVDLSTISPPLVEAKSDKIAIIGSGPAGLACAYHLALKGYRPTILEALPKAGGMLRVGIPTTACPRTSWTGKSTTSCAWGWN